ncbi:MAG: hypothetical protein M1831_000130 [Alyxoria varia]|nr:MAG: hypothetical protein M1831_000130 [Alyxoria varia]
MDALFPPPFLRPDFPTRARLSEILFYEFGRDGRLAAEHFRNSRNAIIQVGQFALIWEWIVNEPPTPSRQWPTYSGWPTCPLPFDTYVGQPRRGLNLEAYIQTCFVMQALVFSRTDARFEYADGNFEFSYTLVNLGRFDILHNLNDMPALAFRFPYFNERRFVPLQGQGGGTHSSGDSTNTNNLAFQQRPPPPVQIQQPRRAQVPARFPPPRQQPPAEPPSTPPPSPLSPPPQGPTAER